MARKKAMTKHTILKGEGTNQHTLYGKFDIEEVEDFPSIEVKERTILKHEMPNGDFGEHKGLVVEKGEWSVGKQVEFNPFTQNITRVWD